MRAALPALALSALAQAVPAAPAGATPLVETPPDPAATAAANAAFAAELAEAREVGAPSEVLAWTVDLDGDGREELVGQVFSLFICGNFGCVFVLQPDGAGGFRRLFFSPGMDAVEVLKSRTGGWRDLAVWRPDELGGPATLIWTGAGYGGR